MQELRRYLFLCPDRKTASGGIAVIYDLVALLNRNGFVSAVVHNSASAGYPDHPENIPPFFTNKINIIHWKYAGIRQKARHITTKVKTAARSPKLPKLHVQPADVIVVPEFMIAEALEGFPENEIIVFVQNPFGLMRSYARAKQRGLDVHERSRYWLGVSHICRTHIEMIGGNPATYFPATMKPADFPFSDHKSPLITFMPRKLPHEASVLAHALRDNGRLKNYRLEALDGLTRSQVAAKMAESRFFISLLHNESIGFPAAEAMSSGCIVVGFDGLGGAEFFDETTGIPVRNGDIAALAQAIEKAVTDYEAAPDSFDEMRQAAAKRVNAAFSVEAFETGALAAWQDIEKVLDHPKSTPTPLRYP